MLASTSLSATLSLLPLCSLPSSLKPKHSLSFSLQPSKPPTSIRSRAPSSVVAAAPEALYSSPETLDGSESSTGFEVEEKSEGSGPSPLAAGEDVKLFSGGGSPVLLRRPFTLLHSSPHEISSVSQEKLIIRNTFGENLVGILHEAGSTELVILCHGFRSSKESKTILNLADALTVENISVFRFDFAGNGESKGSFEYGNYWREVEDLRAVILHFLRQKRGARAIVGHSKGGNVVLLYASKYHDISKMAPKQKIRIKLRSYWVPLMEDSCKQILEAARTTNAKAMGPVPLPTKRRVYCVLKSPHVHKDARFHFEIRTHQRLIDILYPTAQTIDSLMQLDLPAGVDVEVKL